MVFLQVAWLFLKGMTENKATFRSGNWLTLALSNLISFYHRSKCSTEQTRTPLLGAHLGPEVNSRVRKTSCVTLGSFLTGNTSPLFLLVGILDVLAALLLKAELKS